MPAAHVAGKDEKTGVCGVCQGTACNTVAVLHMRQDRALNGCCETGKSESVVQFV